VRSYDFFFSRGGLAALVALAVGSGAVLILSMPWAGRVADFFRFPWHPTPVAFLIAMAFFAAVHALNRGGMVEHLPRLQRRQLLSLPLQVVFAQLLVVPYVVACIVLTSEARVSALWLAWAYVAVVDFALSVAAFHVGRQSIRRAAGVFFPLLALAGVLFGIPLALGLLFAPLRPAALLCPPYVIFSMITTGLRDAELWLAFLVPAGLGTFLFLKGLRQTARSIHEQLP
jgi:hypothetical protein